MLAGHSTPMDLKIKIIQSQETHTCACAHTFTHIYIHKLQAFTHTHMHTERQVTTPATDQHLKQWHSYFLNLFYFFKLFHFLIKVCVEIKSTHQISRVSNICQMAFKRINRTLTLQKAPSLPPWPESEG